LKTAIVFGATGLTGSYVLKILSNNENYSKIKIFTRQPCNTGIVKVEEIITDFKNLNEIATQIMGDVVFCCLGTTIKKAGSREAFKKVDFDLPVQIGEIASNNNIPEMLVISSLGADAGSSNFYLRTKGQMEQELKSKYIPHLRFFRPSMLLGSRTESRPGESIGKILMKAFGWLLTGKLKKYKAIHAETVAKAMVKIAGSGDPRSVFESDTISLIGQEY